MAKIEAMSIKLFGKKETVYRLFKNSELIGVYATKEEAEAAQAVA
jgi:hypothetical protein